MTEFDLIKWHEISTKYGRVWVQFANDETAYVKSASEVYPPIDNNEFLIYRGIPCAAYFCVVKMKENDPQWLDQWNCGWRIDYTGRDIIRTDKTFREPMTEGGTTAIREEIMKEFPKLLTENNLKEGKLRDIFCRLEAARNEVAQKQEELNKAIENVSKLEEEFNNA